MLDKSEPHSIVIGLPGVVFEQDGRYYRHNGDEVSEDGALLAVSDIVLPEQIAPVLAEEAAPARRRGPVPNAELKQLVEQFGGTWTDRTDAIAFLGLPR